MDFKSHPVPGPVTEVLSVTGALDDLPCGGIDGDPGDSRADDGERIRGDGGRCEEF